MRLILPIPTSVNDAYENKMRNGRRMRVLTREAESFKMFAQLKALEWRNKTGWVMPNEDVRIIVRGWFYWGSMQRNDSNNRWKVLLDALEGILYYDDSMCMEQTHGIEYDKQNPRLELEFEITNVWEDKTRVLAERKKRGKKTGRR